MPRKSNNRNQLLFTSILLMTQLSSNVSQAVNQKNKWDDHDDSVVTEHSEHKLQALNAIIPTNNFSPASDTSAPIDIEYIKNLIKGDNEEKNFISECILASQLRIKEFDYIDFTLRYMSDLTISPTLPPTTYIDGVAGYDPYTKTLYLPIQTGECSNKTKFMIIHEMRHAFWHIMQSILGDTEISDNQPFYPITSAEKQKFSLLLKDGDNIILNVIPELLRKEIAVELTDSEQDQLELYRKICKTDDLSLIILLLQNAINTVKRSYPLATHLIEMDAHLLGTFPLPVIKYFYPELFQYHQTLFEQAKKIAAEKNNAKINNIVPQYLNWNGNALKQEMPISMDNCNAIFEMASQLELQGEIAIAKSHLKDLIQKGFCKAESNLLLGQIAFNEIRMEEAYMYFHRARRQGAQFSCFNHADYASILYITKRYKAAYDQAEVASRALYEFKQDNAQAKTFFQNIAADEQLAEMQHIKDVARAQMNKPYFTNNIINLEKRLHPIDESINQQEVIETPSSRPKMG